MGNGVNTPYRQMNQDVLDLYERLRITLRRADQGAVQIADEIEYVLTEGYAYALSLEAEPPRIEARLAALVMRQDTDPAELRKLARRKLDVDEELLQLRSLLEPLQSHCDTLKREGKVAMSKRQYAGEVPDST